MLKASLPVREKMIDLQAAGKISVIGYNWGFRKEGIFMTIEFEILNHQQSTREYICRSFTSKMMEGCVAQALSLLNEIP